MSWTEERIEKLKKLWEQGKTASQIAEELAEGVSRNAVIGKAHRLGLQSRPSPVKTADTSATQNASASSSPTPAPARAAPATKKPAPAPAQPQPAAKVAPAAPTPPAPPQPAPAPAPAAQPQQRVLRPGMPTGPVPPSGPPAPPRRAIPAKPSKEVEGKTSLLDLSDKICKWPIGHPGEPDFHFCGKPSNPGFPYCVEHCAVAYQAQLPRRDRRPAPPPPYGAPRVR